MSAGAAVTVVIPAFNVEDWVRRAIDSALAQDPAPAEVIVVNDGSTDGTADLLASYGDRIRVIVQGNLGLAGARNAGAGAAATDLLLFLDADDALLEGALAAFCAAAERTPGWGAVTCNWIAERTEGDRVAMPSAVDRTLTRSDLATLLRRNWLQTNGLVAAETWRAFPFRDGVTKDLDLWLRLLLADRPIVVLGRPLVRLSTFRPGALTTQRAFMRANRRRTFESMAAVAGLTPTERAIVRYQLVRTSMGEAAARSSELDEDPDRATEALAASPNGLVRATARAMQVPGALRALVAADRGENPS